MSCKRRANVVSEYAEETSSDEEQNDARDFDCDVSSSGRSAPGRQDSNGSFEAPRRRGRGVSKRPCLNRNAQMARENRQRKKEYLEKVESKLAFYRQENKSLSNVIQRQGIDLKRLNAEVSYLKNVLNNSSSITTLLRSMNDTLSGKNLRSQDRRRAETDHRVRRDSGTSISSEKHGATSPRSWNDDASANWRRGGKHADRSAAQDNARVISAGSLKSQSLGDSDHTYTTSGDGSCDGKIRNFEDIDGNDSGVFSKIDGNESGVFSKIAGDRFIGDFAASPLNFGINGDVDDLSQFDADLFDSIGNDASAANGPETTMEFFRHGDFNDEAGNTFESLNNSGICLHVNSGKISLEFCSICHLNSINSAE